MLYSFENRTQDDPSPVVRNLTSMAVDAEHTAIEVSCYLQDRGLTDSEIEGTVIEFRDRQPLSFSGGSYVCRENIRDQGTITVNAAKTQVANKRLIHELEHRIDHSQGNLSEGWSGQTGAKWYPRGLFGFAIVSVVDTLATFAKSHYQRQHPFIPMSEDLQRQFELIATGSKVGYVACAALTIGGYLSYRAEPTERRAHRAARHVDRQLIMKKPGRS